MKLNTAFKLSALAFAMAVPTVVNATTITQSSVNAADGSNNINLTAMGDENNVVITAAKDVVITVDGNAGSVGSFYINKGNQNLLNLDSYSGLNVNTNLTVNGILTANTLAVNTLQHNAVEVNADVVNTKVVDLGSKSSNVFTPGSPNTAQLPVALRLAEDGTTYFYEIADGLGNNAANDSNLPSTYILSGTNLQLFTDTTNSTFVNGGTASNVRVGTTDVTSVTKELDNENLTYAESLKTTNAIQADFAVTDATGSTNANPGVYVDQGRTYDLTNKSIDTGIIGTVGSNNIYGVDLKTEQGKYLASDDSLITGSVNQATLTSDALVIKTTVDDLTKTTEITADGIKLNNVSVATVDDVTTGDEATLAAATAYTDTTAATLREEAAAESVRLDGRVDTVEASVTALDSKVDTEVARLDGRVDTVEASVTALDSKVDTEVNRLDGRVDTVESSVTALDSKVDTEVARLDSDIANANAAATAYTDSTAQTLRDEAATESARVDTAIVAGVTDANDYTDTTAATLRTEAATESARVNTAIVDGDAATLASANATTASTAQTLRTEAAAESARVNTAIVDGDAATLASANAYTNTQVANVNSRMNQLNSRVDDVEKTAYRGIAIALAAQQQIPNIGAGQFAVFGGVGHYEGESAGALGVASVFADGRTSVSAALGFAGGNEVGGRVGVSYVFGGK
ncbi:YadA-like family protein [Acinetobacter pseudolwoffii]|uniref:YadA-like family protein n=1 Tax=Acinetobacter pseudolwoffii TaxID=2053287 RepID=UPI00361B69FB